MLQVLDTQWKEHLAAMDYLRQSIGLRGYAQKNPIQEFKREAFEMFERMLDKTNYEIIRTLSRLQVSEPEAVKEAMDDVVDASYPSEEQLEARHDSITGFPSQDQKDETARREAQEAPRTFRREKPKIGRNDPCWCGSGKKYKHCHGKLK